MSNYKSLYDLDNYDEVLARISSLKQDSSPAWGEMDVAQMMTHVTNVLLNGLDELKLPRKFVGYFIAPFWRHKYFNEHPYKIRNLPSHPNFKVVGSKDFETQKNELLRWLKIFHEEGMVRSKNARHPLLGRFTPEQWGIGQYKHLDHHLRQFGV